MFDADVFMQALEPPAIKVGGRVYTGRVLSVQEFMPFAPRMQAVMDQEVDLPEAMAMVTEFVDATFPRPWYWPFPKRWIGVHKAVRRLPPAAMAEALKDFLQCQVRALTGKDPSDVDENQLPEDQLRIS